MNNYRTYLPMILIAVALSVASAWSQVEDKDRSSVKFALGDDPQWSQPNFDDADWSRAHPQTGNWWARQGVWIEPGMPAEGSDLTVLVLGASEIYWDGKYMGSNGVVAQSAELETPGTWYQVVRLAKDQLDPGWHSLAVRVSSHQSERISSMFGVIIGDRYAAVEKQRRTTAFFISFVGLFLVAGILFIFLYFLTQEELPSLLFGIVSVLVATLLGLEYAKHIFDYPYTFHRPRLVLILLNTAAIGITLPAFFLWSFKPSHKRFILWSVALLVAVMVLFIGNFDTSTLYILRFMTTLCAAMALWAIATRRPGRWATAIGITPLFLLVIPTGYRFADHYFFLGFVFLLIVLLAQMVRTIAQNQKAREEATLRGEALKFALLSKSIQPHFMMNSIAAVISWLEEEPARGVVMLKALAEELRRFLEIGERRSIPLDEEVSLCRSHVATMSHMLDRELHLDVSLETTQCQIPPGVLLTLVENGITHGDFPQSGGQIRLSQVVGTGDQLIYEISNLIAKNSVSNEIQTGTGLRYIRSHLRESYGDDWELDFKAEDNRWTTRISIGKED